jgi:PhzF family phenazine biosynthesis protein
MIPSSQLPALLVEAFSDRACAGNGAGVVLLDGPRPAAWLQALARSIRQSETAFLLPAPSACGPDTWLLRWFTPTCEVPLCGHATLAALLALAAWDKVSVGQSLAFLTRSGRLPASLDADSSHAGTIALPAGTLQAADPPQHLTHLLADLGSCSQGFWQSSLGYAVALLPPQAPLASFPALASQLPENLRSGLVLMQAITHQGQSPLIGAGPADYQLRFFAPGLGIDEDPVTGSAHALVAPLWMEWLGRESVRGWQCSDRPGGMVCRRHSSGMIALSGAGHVLWEGVLSAPPVDGGGQPDDGDWPLLAVPVA